jgi:hypothetical protein
MTRQVVLSRTRLRVGAVVVAALAMAACFSSAGWTLSNYAAGANSNLTFSYTLGTALTGGDYLLEATLPTGFQVTNGSTAAFCNANVAVTIGGSPAPFSPSGNTCSISGSAVEITLGPAASVAVGTAVTVTLGSAIVTNPSTPGVYTISQLDFVTGNSEAPLDFPNDSLSVTITAANQTSIPTLSPAMLGGLGIFLAAAGIAMTRARAARA